MTRLGLGKELVLLNFFLVFSVFIIRLFLVEALIENCFAVWFAEFTRPIMFNCDTLTI